MAALDTIPCEVLMHILSALPGPSLAAASATCRTICNVARCEDLWKKAYRRDFGCDFPPLTHIDFAAHGKSVHWLYALAAVPAGHLWRDSTTRRMCARLVSADAKVVTSGELCLVTDPVTCDTRLCLDGYGSCTTGDGVIREGTWRVGVFTGPGRVFRPLGAGVDYIGTTRCQSFDASLHAQGHGSEQLDDDIYEGCFRNDNREGFGVYKWPNNSTAWAEWSDGRRRGRTFHVNANPGRHTFSGQINYVGTVVSKRGVKRNCCGNLKEGRWENDTHVWKIVRLSTRQTAKAMAICGASTALSANGSVRRSRGTVYRVDTPSGDVVIGDDSGPFFVGLSDACSDPRLAGRRFFPVLDDAQTENRATMTSGGNNRVSRLVPYDHASLLGQYFALYVARSDCALDHKEATLEAIRGQRSSVDVASTTVVGDTTLDDCIRVPFGHLVPAAGGPNARPMIRCFLTGSLVAAIDCRVLSSGRAYGTNALDAWRAHASWRSVDPETGHDLSLPDVVLPWRAWMASIHEPSDLARAINQGYRDPGYESDATQDLTRFNATVLTQRTAAKRPTTCDELRALFAAPVDVARDESGPLVRGFDGVAMTCIELRNPDWDARGPWRLGTPDCALPEDTTIGDHERPDAAPLDHLESHGIARVALESPSFLGAHLEAVFFFGHTLRGASFAGARLVGCAFIGCRFERCVFAGALFSRCHFDECTLVDGTVIDIDAALAAIRKSGML